jgi:threonine dehydratase
VTDPTAAGASPAPRIDTAIGRTPVVRLSRLVDRECAELWVKVEGMNPGGSIKDRTALGMIRDAEASGVLGPAARSSSRRRATPASASHRSRRRGATAWCSAFPRR